MIQRIPMGQCVLLHLLAAMPNFGPSFKEDPFIDYFCVFRGLICFPLFRAFVMIKLFTSGSLIFRTFNTIFTLGQLHLLYWTESSPGTKSSSKCNRTNSLWPKSPYPFWNRPDNFWIWSTLLLYTGKSNIWALEEALIQLWQPRLNTPFFIDSSTAKKASSTALRFRLQGSLVLSLPVAQTTLDLHAKTHSTSSAQLCISQPGRSLGNHSGFEFKLHSPIPNGEEDPLQRHWHSGLLLSTPPLP